MTLRRTVLMASLAASSLIAALPPAALAAGETPPPLPSEIAEAATWYVVIDGQSVGPLTDTAVQRRLADGSIKNETLVWRAGMANWMPAGQAPGMQAIKIEAALKEPRPTPWTGNEFGNEFGSEPRFARAALRP